MVYLVGPLHRVANIVLQRAIHLLDWDTVGCPKHFVHYICNMVLHQENLLVYRCCVGHCHRETGILHGITESLVLLPP
jgi:hypothetical protein